MFRFLWFLIEFWVYGAFHCVLQRERKAYVRQGQRDHKGKWKWQCDKSKGTLSTKLFCSSLHMHARPLAHTNFPETDCHNFKDKWATIKKIPHRRTARNCFPCAVVGPVDIWYLPHVENIHAYIIWLLRLSGTLWNCSHWISSRFDLCVFFLVVEQLIQ